MSLTDDAVREIRDISPTSDVGRICDELLRLRAAARATIDKLTGTEPDYDADGIEDGTYECCYWCGAHVPEGDIPHHHKCVCVTLRNAMEGTDASQ